MIDFFVDSVLWRCLRLAIVAIPWSIPVKNWVFRIKHLLMVLLQGVKLSKLLAANSSIGSRVLWNARWYWESSCTIVEVMSVLDFIGSFSWCSNFFGRPVAVIGLSLFVRLSFQRLKHFVIFVRTELFLRRLKRRGLDKAIWFIFTHKYRGVNFDLAWAPHRK